MSKESMALNMKKQVYKMCIWKLILGGGVNHAYPEKEEERGWSRNASIEIKGKNKAGTERSFGLTAS